MREALKPFVVPRDGAHANAPDDASVVYQIDDHQITVGDFRRARAALSSAPSPAAGLSEDKIAETIHDARYGPSYPEELKQKYQDRDANDKEYYRRIARAMIATLSFPAAGSDGRQRDAALEEAAALCEREAAENENSRSDVIDRSFFEIKAEEDRQLAKSVRALKSAAPTPSTASDGQ
jgi:hypothetical protein